MRECALFRVIITKSRNLKPETWKLHCCNNRDGMAQVRWFPCKCIRSEWVKYVMYMYVTLRKKSYSPYVSYENLNWYMTYGMK